MAISYDLRRWAKRAHFTKRQSRAWVPTSEQDSLRLILQHRTEIRKLETEEEGHKLYEIPIANAADVLRETECRAGNYGTCDTTLSKISHNI